MTLSTAPLLRVAFVGRLLSRSAPSFVPLSSARKALV